MVRAQRFISALTILVSDSVTSWSIDGGHDGYLLDGQTALQQPIHVTLKGNVVSYITIDGRNGSWDFAVIDWYISEFKTNPVRIKNTQIDDAWLVITNPQIGEDLRLTQRQWNKNNFNSV